MNTFSIKAALAVAWRTLEEKPKQLILASVILGVFQVAFETLFPPVTDGSQAFSSYGLVTLISVILWSLVSVYILTVLSWSLRRGYPLLSSAHWKVHLLPMFLVMTFLFYLGTLAGVLALLIPGLVFFAAYSMTIYVMVDKEVGVIKSFRESAHLTKGSRWKILALALGTMLAVTVTLFLCGVVIDAVQGLFAFVAPRVIVTFLTYTVYTLVGLTLCVASADAYLQLSGRSASDSGQ